MLTKEESLEKVAELLKKLGVGLVGLATDPRRLDQATDQVWRAAPFWLKPFGKERLRAIIYQLSERIPQGSSVEDLAEPSIDARLTAVEQAIHEEFGDTFGTTRSLRGFDAKRDLACGRLLRELESLEQLVGDGDSLIGLLLAKAQLLGVWQKIQGSKGNQQSAVACYERAVLLAEGLPEIRARALLRYSRFCEEADDGIAGGKEKAKELAESAVAAAPPGSLLADECESHLERLSKRRWFF